MIQIGLDHRLEQYCHLAKYIEETANEKRRRMFLNNCGLMVRVINMRSLRLLRFLAAHLVVTIQLPLSLTF
jgi:hypothetical protein